MRREELVEPRLADHAGAMKGFQIHRKEIQAGAEANPSPTGRKSKENRKEIQIKSFHFLRRIESFQGLTPDPPPFSFLKPILALEAERQRWPSLFASGCYRSFLSSFAVLLSSRAVKGWRRFDRGRLDALSVRLSGREPQGNRGKRNVHGSTGHDPWVMSLGTGTEERRKDRPIDPMSGKNTSA
jgi:hypothetical protein